MPSASRAMAALGRCRSPLRQGFGFHPSGSAVADYEYPFGDRSTHCKTERKRPQKDEQGKLRGEAVDDHFKDVAPREREEPAPKKSPAPHPSRSARGVRDMLAS